MRFRTILASGIALALPLLLEAAGKQDCPTEPFELQIYAKWEDKYLIKYRGKNTTNPDIPEEIVDKSLNSYQYNWAEEAKGTNDTLKMAGLYIERVDITNELPFEIHFSDKIPSGKIPLFAPEVYGQSLRVSFPESSASLH